MNYDAIIEEIREFRHCVAARFDNDVYRIGAEIRRGQLASGHRVVQRPRRRPVTSHAANQSTYPTEMGGGDSA
jgi:hypothetical protein